jgi:hypothetical protein
MSTVQRRPIVIAGHSNIIALGVPIHDKMALELQPISPPHERAEVMGLVGPSVRSPAYWDELVNIASGKTIALCFAGGQHYTDFMFAPARFDFVPASRPDLPRLDIPLVPEELVRAHFSIDLALLDTVLERLSKVNDCRLVVLATPPPKQGNEAAIAMVRCNPSLVAWAKHHGKEVEDIELIDDIILLKMWVTIQDLMREAAERHGARFIEVPSEAQDEVGFLPRPLWQPDLTHANAEYGRIFLEKIIDAVAVQ